MDAFRIFRVFFDKWCRDGFGDGEMTKDTLQMKGFGPIIQQVTVNVPKIYAQP